MTNDDRQSRGEHYRDIADSIRQLARQTRYLEIREELFDLADRFERMAEHAEKWQAIDR